MITPSDYGIGFVRSIAISEFSRFPRLSFSPTNLSSLLAGDFFCPRFASLLADDGVIHSAISAKNEPSQRTFPKASPQTYVASEASHMGQFPFAVGKTPGGHLMPSPGPKQHSGFKLISVRFDQNVRVG